MREIKREVIVEAVKAICSDAHYELDTALVDKLKSFRAEEEHKLAIDVLDTIIENQEIAKNERKPLCQDTGIGIFFVEMGREVYIPDGSLSEILEEAMSEVYLEEPFRFSVVSDPLFGRVNTGNNTPPMIHWDIVDGDQLTITFMPKGGGAENTSALKMFNPLDPLSEISDFIVNTVKEAGGKPCPPILVGVGIGGSFDYAALLAKKALLTPLNESNPNPKWAELEQSLLERINSLGIGPMGLGGKTTALSVKIKEYPCHIASLPVAINIQCHSHRHKTVII
ncbi:MAG: fumarate hydratase [Candidatus Cloacimonas sp.]|nr:fumarate hydratase [Candidatus Cloacimonadota bacterium]